MNYVKDLVHKNDPILYTKLERFDFSNPQFDPIELSHTLTQTMIYNKGIGLSANQIGLPFRCFSMMTNPITVCFNPTIIDESTETVILEEGCLTYPNFYVKVKRPKIIKVRYFEPNGEVQTKKFIGMTARIFQHELDHLNGEKFTRTCSRLVLDMAIKKSNNLGMNYTIKDFM